MHTCTINAHPTKEDYTVSKDKKFALNCLLFSLLLFITGAGLTFDNIGVLVSGLLSLTLYTAIYFRLERLDKIQSKQPIKS